MFSCQALVVIIIVGMKIFQFVSLLPLPLFAHVFFMNVVLSVLHCGGALAFYVLC